MKEIRLLVTDKTYTSDEMALALETLASIGLVSVGFKSTKLAEPEYASAGHHLGSMSIGDKIRKRDFCRKYALAFSDCDAMLKKYGCELSYGRPAMIMKTCEAVKQEQKTVKETNGIRHNPLYSA